MQGELYYAFAEHDQSVPANVIPTLNSALAAAGTAHTLEVYPGTHHGFCFAERQTYDPLAAEATWDKIFALWARHLH